MLSATPASRCRTSFITEKGDVGSHYILVSKIDGVQLSSVWTDMEDDKRRTILRQVIHIVLELWSHRFSESGALLKRPGYEGKDAWYIEPSFLLDDPEDNAFRYRIASTAYPHAADYWLAYATAHLHDVSETHFGSHGPCVPSSLRYSIRPSTPMAVRCRRATSTRRIS